MEANARHDPGSTPSCRTPLSRSATLTQRFQAVPKKSVQNPYKSDQFRKVKSFNDSESTTCSFNTLKCTDFPDVVFSFGTGRGRQSLATEFQDVRLKGPVDSSPFSPGEKVRMRDKPQWPFRSGPAVDKRVTTVQIRTFPDDLRILKETTAQHQRLTTTLHSVVRFWILESRYIGAPARSLFVLFRANSCLPAGRQSATTSLSSGIDHAEENASGGRVDGEAHLIR